MSAAMQPTAEPRLVGPEADIDEIRACHRDWWAANHSPNRLPGQPRASRNFAPDALMFNLNGHPYYGLDEMQAVWRFYLHNIDNDVVLIWDLRIFVEGDLAYLTAEGIMPIRKTGEEGWAASNAEPATGDATPIRFRETSVFRRDDGHGNRTWKIWHFHCSPLAPPDEQRPGFDDTWTTRGGDHGGVLRMTAEKPL